MVLIVEGVDAVGKTTQINNLVKEAQRRYIIPHILHYANVKGIQDNSLIEDYSMIEYNDIFKFMEEFAIPSNNLFIYDRCHLSEYVYSPMYRNYNGNYIYALEKRICPTDERTKLVLFMDTAENIIQRDKARGDGQSFTLDLKKKQEELFAFTEAFNKSSIKDKKVISIAGKSIEDVSKEFITFVFGEPK